MAITKVPVTLARCLSTVTTFVFRRSNGRLGASLKGAPVVLVTTIGRKTGQLRTTPLIANQRDDGWIVVASFSGHDHHPAWYLNARDEPRVSVDDGRTQHAVHAVELAGDERADAWDEMVQLYADYDDYRNATTRQIPVLLLRKVERE